MPYAQRHSATNRFVLTEEQVLALASDRIVRRGLAYARAGRVTDLVASGARIEARVQGSRAEPYLVTIEHDGEEILPACTCPFDWEPFCKHAIATLATLAKRPGNAIASPPLPQSQIEDEELEVRRARAEKQGFRIRRVEGRGFFGSFEVGSPSGKRYTVQIRSLGERLNHCTCLDHATSMLGTCKHIEAVLAAHRKRGARRFDRIAARPPEVAQVLVERGETPRIRLVLPDRPSAALRELAREFFDDTGSFRRDLADDFPAFLERARRLRGLVVYDDARALALQAADERVSAQRREEVYRAVTAAGAHIAGVRARLYPYQVEGAAFLASRGRALLADDMGLGKTIQAIAAARILLDRGEVGRVLIICPASLKHQWAAEIERFIGERAQIVGGGTRTRLDQYRAGAPFTIANYELALRDHRPIAELAPELLILDEAQRIKNWRAKTAEAIKGIRTRFAFVLTGTPLQNRLDDLYSIMQVVDRRVLGPLWAFNERFINRELGRNRIAGYRNLGELRRRLTGVMLRREKEEVRLQLPARIDTRIGVALTPLQRGYMEDAQATAARLAKLAEKRPLLPKELERLFMAMQTARMACDAAGLVDKETAGSPKLDEFTELVRDLCVERERKVVVFSEWEKFGRMAALRAEALGLGYVRLHGGVPSAKRGDLIARFRDDPSCRLFISTDAGGVGLNLQFASALINLDLPWNPAVLEHRIARLHRHGQTQPVNVLLLVAEDSFESKIERVLSGKRALFGAALKADSEIECVNAPSSCLSTVREALITLKADEPEGRGPVLEEAPEETDDEAVGSQPQQPEREDPSAKLAGLLGPRLFRVLATPSGRLVAVVDRLDDTTRAAGEQAGAVVTERAALDSLASLGDEAPLAGSQTLFERDPAAQVLPAPDLPARVAIATRKLTAARKLAAADLPAEAIEQAMAAMSATLRALLPHDGGGADLPPARLLYEVLVPRGLLSLEQAAKVSRAESLARVYTDTESPVPPEILASVLADAEGVLALLPA